LSSALGAEAVGLDLSEPVSQPVVDALRMALDESGVLLFRNQRLDPAAHIAVSRRFGELQEVAQKQYQLEGQPLIYVIGNVEENGRPIGDPSVGRLWHSAQSFLHHPAVGSLLYGLQCPAEGAATLFANMYAAYDALPAQMRALVGRLHAVHSFSEYYEGLRHRVLQPGGDVTLERMRPPRVISHEQAAARRGAPPRQAFSEGHAVLGGRADRRDALDEDVVSGDQPDPGERIEPAACRLDQKRQESRGVELGEERALDIGQHLVLLALVVSGGGAGECVGRRLGHAHLVNHDFPVCCADRALTLTMLQIA
jgi:hypothetical protein